MNEILKQLGILGTVPVVAIENADSAPKLGRALAKGGLPCAEITFRTPAEINMTLNKKLTLLKSFPAEAAGGVKTLKAIGGPYGGVKFIPTGGINPTNLPVYLSLPMVHACGGSWLVKKQLIADGEFEKITTLTAEALELVREVRS